VACEVSLTLVPGVLPVGHRLARCQKQHEPEHALLPHCICDYVLQVYLHHTVQHVQPPQRSACHMRHVICLDTVRHYTYTLACWGRVSLHEILLECWCFLYGHTAILRQPGRVFSASYRLDPYRVITFATVCFLCCQPRREDPRVLQPGAFSAKPAAGL
jgi:hypothetical protein